MINTVKTAQTALWSKTPQHAKIKRPLFPPPQKKAPEKLQKSRRRRFFKEVSGQAPRPPTGRQAPQRPYQWPAQAVSSKTWPKIFQKEKIQAALHSKLIIKTAVPRFTRYVPKSPLPRLMTVSPLSTSPGFLHAARNSSGPVRTQLNADPSIPARAPPPSTVPGPQEPKCPIPKTGTGRAFNRSKQQRSRMPQEAEKKIDCSSNRQTGRQEDRPAHRRGRPQVD